MAAEVDTANGSQVSPKHQTDSEYHWRLQAKKLQRQLDVNEYDEHEGQSTENEQDEESVDEETATEQTPVKTESSKLEPPERETPKVESSYGEVPKEEQSDMLIESQDVAVSDI